MSHQSGETKRVSVLSVQAKADRGEPITMLTAYDYPTGLLADRSGVDMILVGDSLAMVVLGHENTLSVTMDEMLHHARAVRRGASRALLLGDMPFMSYQASVEDAVRNAGRFLAEAGMDGVKLEGGRTVVDRVRAIVAAGIPVQGHVGLTPQSVNALGGWRIQGRTASAARELLLDAQALEEAGCFSIVLESVPAPVATAVTERLCVPTIGIGAGVGTSGQVLVIHDLLGIYDRFTPKFVKRYAEIGAAIESALAEYVADVGARRFPGTEHTYPMDEGELDKWRAFLDENEAGAEPTRVAVRKPVEAASR